MLVRLCSILVTLLLVLGAQSVVPASLAAQDDEDEKEDGDSADDDESYEEPDAWEAPPMEKEKPKAEMKAPPPAEVAGDGHPYMVGLLVGWGFKTDRSTGGLGADPYGLGLGVAGGYTFPFQLYVGLRYMYFLGSSESSTGGRPPVPTESSANYMHIVGEAGYDLWAGNVLIRPSMLIGAGLALWELKGVDNVTSDTLGDFMIGPGFSVIYPMSQGKFFIGGDLRGNLVLGDGVSGVGVMVTGGARFME